MYDAFSGGETLEGTMRRILSPYGDSLVRMCYAYLKDHSLAEDAALDTFVKAFQNCHKVCKNVPWNEKTWIMRIAINTCKDHRRTAWFRHIDRRIYLNNVACKQIDLSIEARALVEAAQSIALHAGTINR